MTIIEKILEYCTQIAGTHKRFNDSYEQFETDFIYRNAICLCLLQIGELSGKLSNEFKEDNDEIPWCAIRGIAQHGSTRIWPHRYPTLWNTSHKYILELKSFCETVLAVEERKISRKDLCKRCDRKQVCFPLFVVTLFSIPPATRILNRLEIPARGWI